MNYQYYSSMLPTLADRASNGVLSTLGFSNNALRAHLYDMFEQPFGVDGNFISDPAFEATYGWDSENQRVEDLSGELLSSKLIEAIHGDEFKKSWKPYKHQLKSWKLLTKDEPQSVVVTSGTGSGKTECFMIPILDDLVKEWELKKKQLTGVRALFLYPLNALINSQRDRLKSWTKDFKSDIRFCLYNGLTSEKVPYFDRKKTPNEVLDRKTLRENSPPILVTNPTMLEYMLVRAKDRNIIEQSKGKLNTIVLDEAHTYIGSQAAEMALLLRRVLHAFDKKPEEVRFIATSATIGEDGKKAGKDLEEFLTRLSGVPKNNVHVVEGRRDIPALNKPKQLDHFSLSELEGIGSKKDLYNFLKSDKTALKIRKAFTDIRNNVIKLSDVCKILFGDKKKYKYKEQLTALKWLDLLSKAKDKNAFLPLRTHIFHNTLSGIWACCNSNCSKVKNSKLDEEEWPFGKVYLESKRECDCGAPVYEVVSCSDCGTVYLQAQIKQNILKQVKYELEFDEFELDINEVTNFENEIDEELNETLNSKNSESDFAVISNKTYSLTGKKSIDSETREFLNIENEDGLEIEIREYLGDTDHVCPACEGSYKRGSIFRTHRVGSPFILKILLPTLLEYANSHENASNLPYFGRRLLTFNDSRQGTARLATKLQQDSERTKARSLIYHHVLQLGQNSNDEEINEIQEYIKGLEKVVDDGNENLENLLNKQKAKRDQLTGFSNVQYRDLLNKLENESGDYSYLCNNFAKYNSNVFEKSRRKHNVSKLLISREFARRPVRQNNLETMGLVALTYPQIDKVKLAPKEWKKLGYSLNDWKNYLKICMDFFIRSGGTIDIDDKLRNWLGFPFYQYEVVPQDYQDAGSYQRRWPNFSRGKSKSRVVRYLIYLITEKKNYDLDNPELADIVDDLLDTAWHDLTRIKLLTQKQTGRTLPLENLHFTILNKVWICPITRRFLDTTVEGFTPFIPKFANSELKCEEVNIPRYDKPFGGDLSHLDRIKRAREWVSNNDTIKKLRKKGHWSLFNDRVLELQPYYASAEHSAQQSSQKLKKYERYFKEGRLNILSCSTTMEMGIDIGGIQIIAMNNVPPHPANYLQRAGRAGRRDETQSTSVTLCKSNPHDQYVFSNSDWAFTTKLPAPKVALDSQTIVQRHVNALILSHYLNDKMGLTFQDKHSIKAGWFFDKNGKNVADQYINWCKSVTIDQKPNLDSGIKQLVFASILENQVSKLLLEESAIQLAEIRDSWRAEFEVISQQEQEVLEQEGDTNNPALLAIRHKKTRIENEYLLKDLASNGFLPAYGFPSNITAFDNYTIDEFKYEQNRQDKEEREDNHYSRRELASRDIVAALREYAPGSEVVMDGKVYKSAGITLNWHIPTSERDVKESQAIKRAWRCKECGDSNATLTGKIPSHCGSCGATIKANNIVEYLEPSGFSVDFYETPTNDVSHKKFIPIKKPWIQAKGEWSPLPNPILGRFKSTNEGQIFHFSSGLHNEGYALCMMCGRAEPMKSDQELPKIFRHGNSHKKLRGGKDGEICPGSENRWAIKKKIELGHQLNTDILQLQLRNIEGEYLKDKSTAATIAVALRDSLAEVLGIEARELSCDIAESNIDGIKGESIYIFDKYSSGYVSSADHLIEKALVNAREKMICPNNCKSNCPKCILDFDQRFNTDDLNRIEGLKFLNKEWINLLSLPNKFKYFDNNSRIETSQLSVAINNELQGNPGARIILFAGGDPDKSDFALSEIRNLSYQYAGRHVPIQIVISDSLYSNLEDEDRFSLASLIDHDLITLDLIEKIPISNGGYLLASVQGKTRKVGWAVNSKEMLIPNNKWGLGDSPIVRGEFKMDLPVGEEINVDEVRPEKEIVKQGDKEVEIGHQLNGPLNKFGKHFWNLIEGKHNPLDKLLDSANKVTSITYSDRYLFSPLSVALVLELIEGLRNKVDEKNWEPTITINTSGENRGSNSYGNKIYTDWRDIRDRDDVLLTVFERKGMEVKLNTPHQGKLKHGRVLEIQFSNSEKAFIRFDQGVGYWRADTRGHKFSNDVMFNFTGRNFDYEKEAEELLNSNPDLKGSYYNTQLFIKVRE